MGRAGFPEASPLGEWTVVSSLCPHMVCVSFYKDTGPIVLELTLVTLDFLEPEPAVPTLPGPPASLADFRLAGFTIIQVNSLK